MSRPISRNTSKKRGADLGVPVAHGNLWLHELRSRVFGNTRLVRVWLPPDYDGWGATRYPVLYLNDGQNLFDPATAFAGVHWQVGEAASLARAEKTRAVETDIHKGSLHAGQHALHAAQDDVADQARTAGSPRPAPRAAVFAADGAFEKELLEAPVLDHRDTNFPGSCIDQDFLLHGPNTR